METLLSEILSKVKLARRIKTSAFDTELTDLIKSAISVLETRGLDIISTTEADGETTYSVEPMVLQAIITYVGLHFGQPDDYERLKESWETQLGQLMTTTGYTRW